MSYGTVATDRQGEIIKRLGAARESKQPGAEDIDTLEAVVKRLRAANSPTAL